MADGERQRQLLEDVFVEAHRATRRRTPPFAELWARAVAESSAAPAARRRGPRRRLAVAAAALAVVVVASTLALWLDRRRSRQLDRALTVAAAVGEWQAPLDFLLATPGREWLDSAPRWDPLPDAPPRWDLTAPRLPETDPPRSDPS